MNTIVNGRDKFVEKSAFLSTRGLIQRLLDCYPKSYVPLKEDLYSYRTGYTTERNHFLHELADEIIQKLVTGGIIEYSIKYYIFADQLTFKVYHRLDFFNESKVLTMNDFSYGFTLWIVACLICIVVFLLEFTTFHIKIDPVYHLKNFIGLVGFLSAFEAINKSYFVGLGINMSEKLKHFDKRFEKY